MSLEVTQLGKHTVRPWPTAGGGVCVWGGQGGMCSRAWREGLSRPGAPTPVNYTECPPSLLDFYFLSQETVELK